MMDELGPDAKELLQAGRRAFRPTPSDRERVFAALAPHIGAVAAGAGAGAAGGAGGAGTGAPVASVAGLGAVAKWSLAVIGVGVAAGGLYLGTASEAVPVAPPVTPPASTVAEVPVPEAAPVEVVPTAVPSAESREPAPVRAPRSEDHLDEEVAVLSRASAALRSGQPAAALRALDEHQRRFPSGVLSQERSAARVQALCALGRTAEGRAELSRLEKRAPRSPLTARARKACGPEPGAD